MTIPKMPMLKIGDLEIKVPIIQGGMGVGISLANLASAVSNEGGVGVISSIGLGLLYPKPGSTYAEANKSALQNEIRKARMRTDSILGINIMLAITDFDDIVKVALDEEIDIIFLGAGLPLKIPQNLSLEYLLKSKTKIIPIVSSARAAKIIFSSWEKKYNHIPDAVVVEGPMAGGHLGFKNQQINDPEYALEKLLPDLLEVISQFEEKFNKKIPVIAAGGIYSGKDIYKFIKLGASAVQLGTRFVATDECDASDDFKKQYMDCSSDDIGIIKSPVGLPGRAIINNFLKNVASGIKKPYKCPFKCLKTCDYQNAPYCIALALVNAKNGKFDNGFAFCGSNAFKIENIISVKKLMSDLQDEYEAEALLNQDESLKDFHKVI